MHDEIRGFDAKALQKRNTDTFQALMSTMSIMESKAAITQGHKMEKLTELAFVFIPMSFVASVFGMEVKVWLHSNFMDL